MRAYEFIIEELSDPDLQYIIDPFVSVPKLGELYYILMVYVDNSGKKLVTIMKTESQAKLLSIDDEKALVDYLGDVKDIRTPFHSPIPDDYAILFFRELSDMESLISHLYIAYEHKWDLNIIEMPL